MAEAETPIKTPRTMRTFLIIWSGQFVSILGSALTDFALGVWLYQQTGKATPLAIVGLFATVPRILITPLAGSLADRWNRRWLMILADTGSALTALAVVLLLTYGRLEMWNIYIIVVVGTIFGAFQGPAYQASVSMIVPKDQLARANGLAGTSEAISGLLAPMMAGFLFGWIGLGGILWIDFVTYFFAVGALLLVRIPQPPIKEEPAGQTKRGRTWRDAKFGWNYLRERGGLFGLLWYYALVNFLLSMTSPLMTVMVLATSTPQGLGAVHMATNAGMLLGSLTLSAWGGPKGRRIPAVICFIALAGAGLAFAGLRAALIFPMAGMFLLLFCIPLASGSSQTVFQRKVAPEVQGRVFAIRSMIGQAAIPLAFLSAGPLADLIFEPVMRAGGALAGSPIALLLGSGPGRGVGLIFVLAGLLMIVVSAFAYANPRLRNVESELPDALPG